MGKTRAEIQKDYRERKKQTLGQAYLEQENNRVKKYFVPAAFLTKQDLKKRRGYNKHQSRKYRLSKKKIQKKAQKQQAEDESVPSSSSSNPHLIVNFKFKNKAGSPSAACKAKKEVKVLKSKLTDSQKRVKTLTKRVERLQKTDTKCTTPRSKTATQIREAGLSPRFVPRSLRRQIEFSHVLVDQINDASKYGPGKRKMVASIVAGRVMKRYRFFNKLSFSVGIARKTLASSCKSKQFPSQKRKATAHTSMLHTSVKQFLERDDNSRQMPGKRDAIIADGEKKQTRILNDYIHNLHAKFCSENPEIKISPPTFYRIRRQQCAYIKLVKFTSRNTSLCKRHQNLALKLQMLKSEGLTTCVNPDDFVKMYDESKVQNMLSSIKGQNVEFTEWRVDDNKDRGRKMKLTRVTMSCDQFKEYFTTEVNQFRDHVFRVKAQYQELLRLKNNLPTNHVVLQMDFSENYVCSQMNEIQSAYWNQSAVTIHPFVMYYNSENEEESEPSGSSSLKHASFVAISDSLSHAVDTVIACIKEVIPKIREIIPTVNYIHYWTDSPTSQYRNKTMFSVIGDHERLFGCKASWSYFESGHGKGPCDGIGGTSKRMADEAVRRQAATIQDARDYFAWASSISDSKITYFWVGTEEVNRASVITKQWSSVKPVNGTMKTHAVFGHAHDARVIFTRTVSCFCPNCFNSGGFTQAPSQCTGWEKQTLQRKENKPMQVIGLPTITVETSASTSQSRPKPKTKGKRKGKSQKWLCIVCDGDWVDSCPNEVWIKCQGGCDLWAHEDCAVTLSNYCDSANGLPVYVCHSCGK